MTITGVSLGLGTRLKKPDDFFSAYFQVSYQHYDLHNYSYMDLFSFTEGRSNNINLQAVLSRNNSGPGPIYPWYGTNISLAHEWTLPYSYWRGDHFWELDDEEKEGLTLEEIQSEEDQRKYKFVEYHKYSFKTANYTSLWNIDGKHLVLHTKFELGYVAFYNQDIGPSPFEGYYMGGDGLMTYNLYGKETIPLRGYDQGALTPYIDPGSSNSKKSGNIYDKFTFELRFPLSMNPSATLYAHTFLEAGNAWYDYDEFNPFDVKRAAGFGVRIFMPMFGKLGVDWGYGFDNDNNGLKSGSQFHFIIGQNF